MRFEHTAREAFDDGWGTLEAAFAELPPLPTTLTKDSAKSALAWNQSPDIGFDRAVNPYRGCEHGCVYCYARPSHAYSVPLRASISKTRLLFKLEVAALLEKELRKPGYDPKPIALGSNTDPYQPVERTLKRTRGVLEVLDRFNHPVTIVTNRGRAARPRHPVGMAKATWCGCARRSPPSMRGSPASWNRAPPPPERRLAAVRALAAAGIPAAVLAAPMIPAAE